MPDPAGVGEMPHAAQPIEQRILDLAAHRLLRREAFRPVGVEPLAAIRTHLAQDARVGGVLQVWGDSFHLGEYRIAYS
jgi:hypothetical protein